LTLLTTLFFGSVIGAVLIGLWFVAKPYLYVQFYKKQGAQGYFKPFGGFFMDRMTEARQNNDFFAYFKEVIFQKPDTQVIVSNVASKPVLFLVQPDMIKEFLNQPQLYRKTKFISGVEGLFEGQGILFTEGNQWKKQRRLLTATFQNELLKEQIPLMAKITEKVYDTIGTTPETKDLNRINIMKLNQRIAGDIIGEFYFGSSYGKHTFEGQSLTMGLRKLLKDGFKQMYTVWNWLFGAWFIRSGILPQHKQLMERIRSLRVTLLNIILEAKRRKNVPEEENSLIQNLLELQKQSPENALTDDEIADNFISLFLAATDTTGNLVSMIFYYLSKNPEIFEKTFNEIQDIVKSKTELSFEDLHKMDYTMAVIKETLRVANPQGLLVFREAIEDHELKGLQIKRGTLITFSPLLNGFNEKYFTDIDKFDPSRWLVKREKSIHPFAFIPFSAGPRSCPGQHLTFIEAKIMLSCFLMKYKMSVSNDYTLKMTNRGTYEPLQNIRMSLIEN